MLDIIPPKAFFDGGQAPPPDNLPFIQSKEKQQEEEEENEAEKKIIKEEISSSSQIKGKEGKVRRVRVVGGRFFISSLSILACLLLVGLAIFAFIKWRGYSKEIFKEEKKVEGGVFENIDRDGDGLTTIEEMIAGTLSEEFDTDGDDMPDGWEVENKLNPLDYLDAVEDLDEDKLSNLREYEYDTDPANPDTDGDGFKDGNEVANGYNPKAKGKLEIKKDETSNKEASKENLIIIKDGKFQPDKLEIKQGDEVIWENRDSKVHTVISEHLDSGRLAPGEKYRYKFEEKVEEEYYCGLHEGEVGKIVVK